MEIYLPIIICLAVLILILLALLLKKSDRNDISEDIDKIRQETVSSQAELRKEINSQLTNMNNITLNTISKVSSNTMLSIEQIRGLLDQRIALIRQENEQAIGKIQSTLDTQLSDTLSSSLTKSFTSVNSQLSLVTKSINDISSISPDIKNLKNILSNVKNRGTWGEVQLGSIIEDMFAPSQYEAQFAINNSSERVDYVLRLPGSNREQIYLPIDSKFPMDRYDNLISAENSGNRLLTDTAKQAFIKAVKDQAKSIQKKYIVPPYTTDFALMFVPSEGMYAFLASENVIYTIQQEQKVILTGPSTLAALLNTFLVGFQTLEIQEKTAEIIKILQGVKKSIGSISENVAATQKSMNAALNNLEKVAQNTRGLDTKLKNIDSYSDGVPED